MNHRKGYKFAIDWIAENDDPETLDAEMIEAYITVGLVADLYGKAPWQVALFVLRSRLAREAAKGNLPDPDPEPARINLGPDPKQEDDFPYQIEQATMADLTKITKAHYQRIQSMIRAHDRSALLEQK